MEYIFSKNELTKNRCFFFFIAKFINKSDQKQWSMTMVYGNDFFAAVESLLVHGTTLKSITTQTIQCQHANSYTKRSIQDVQELFKKESHKNELAVMLFDFQCIAEPLCNERNRALISEKARAS